MTATDLNDASAPAANAQGRWTGPGVMAFVFLAAFACFVPLPADSPLAGTEGHRAVTAHQMVTSGEWLVPRMFGRVYLAKPPLHYWLQATFETISGHATPFIWRLPSAVEGAILATILCWLAARWFGGVAGIVGGLAYVALIAMWGEDRGADIDLTNALVSTIAAICLLELQFGLGRHRAWWTILGGIAIGASFLTKGPCGLPPILGALIWIAIVRIRERKVASLLRPEIWLPFVIGASIFGTYAFATYHYIHSHHMASDLTGLQEGTQDLHPHDWSVARATGILVLPVIMFLYAMPISLALPLSFLRGVRDGVGDATRRSRMIALAATILLAWLVCFLSGMHLPRYAYVTLPLMCPLAGAVAVSVPRLDAMLKKLVLAIAAGGTVLFGFAVIGTTCVLLRHASIRPLVIATSVIAVTTAVMMMMQLLKAEPNWNALIALPIILICLAQNVGYISHYDRLRRSSRDQAEMIRSITGPNASLVTCMMVLDQPELFYYTGLPTTALDGDMLDWHDVKSGTWVVLEPPELEKWQREVPTRLKQIHPFVANRNPGELVWYSASD